MQQNSLPDELVKARSRLPSHPEVLGSQLFTTAKGGWGLRVQVRPGTTVPLAELRDLARKFEIVYDTEPSPLPEARPAYPSRGE